MPESGRRERRGDSENVRLREIASFRHSDDLRARNDNLAANNNALNARATKAEARVAALEAALDCIAPINNAMPFPEAKERVGKAQALYRALLHPETPTPPSP